MAERRNHKRHSGTGVRCSMVLCPEVMLIDISLGGALIETTRRMNMGSTCLLEIQKNGASVKVSSVVIRSMISGSRGKKDGDVIPVYQAALEFRGLSEEKVMMLLDIMREASSENRFEDLRFTVHCPSVMDYPFNYRVRNVGLEGMEVETDREFGEGENVTMNIFVEEHLPVEFTGKVTSCRKLPEMADGPRYEVGFAFTDMSEEMRSDIVRYIDAVS